MPDREDTHVTRVLYVEDHEAQRDIMGRMLGLYGYEVDLACDGEEGMEKAREWHPDVVLMDIGLPGQIDGFTAIRQLRDSPGTTDIPIFALSVLDTVKYKTQALRAGADIHFTKPVPIDKLTAAINRRLG
jgi:CheY-like chemotaxis protein